MMMVMMVVLMLVMLRSGGSLMTREVGLVVMVEMMGVEEVIKRHSAEELPEYVHRILEDEVEMSLT